MNEPGNSQQYEAGIEQEGYMKTAIWDAFAKPPKSALKTIKGGRLRGMTDVNPQWRYRAMTEQFGMCGQGWKYEIKRLWTEPGSEGQVMAFAEIALSVAKPEPYENVVNHARIIPWSDPIPGIGGSVMIAREWDKTREEFVLHGNDEAYKMAVTDALSVAMKMLGVAADIYMGLLDGSKYREDNSKAITPLTGVEEMVAPDRAPLIIKTAEAVHELIAKDDVAGAYGCWESAEMDVEETAYFWKLLKEGPSRIEASQRRALKEFATFAESKETQHA